MSETEQTQKRRTPKTWMQMKDWTLEEILETVLRNEADADALGKIHDRLSDRTREIYSLRLTVARRDSRIADLQSQIKDLEGQNETLSNGLKAMTAVQARLGKK